MLSYAFFVVEPPCNLIAITSVRDSTVNVVEMRLACVSLPSKKLCKRLDFPKNSGETVKPWLTTVSISWYYKPKRTRVSPRKYYFVERLNWILKVHI